MRVELLNVGDELLRGDIFNGNAGWLGRRLTEAGVEVVRDVVVPDDTETIITALREALERADAVIVTGGLGGTSDDVTRDALARAAGVALRRDPDLEARLRERAVTRGVPLAESALRMADVPEGARRLPNPAGTAPGLRVELPGGVAYAVPGVPDEMRAIVDEHVLPELTGTPVAARVLRTATVWESVVAARLAPVEALPGVRLAYYPAPGEVRVRITATGEDRVAEATATARDLLGGSVYAEEDLDLDRVVHRLLAERNATVAVAESLTGGLLGAELTGMPGSSATFLGGVVAYATPLKHSLLGVPADLLAAHGAVHPDVAAAMATGVRERLGASYGLAVTGVAGPEPQDGKPVGTVHIGLAEAGGPPVVRSVRLPVAGDGERSRGPIRRMTVVHALDLLRRHLLTLEFSESWSVTAGNREEPG
ncbi:CinA family nicotinamide mononucleotide deamidase-related protein [Actinoallomurus rhizosphaericola]|uniref:CinA family nicotinamide mononucleotide deamidase-related protein n=1 Tax=Actinoallomurus rhizosphaericola TaxID=2952536 RepID=UPI002090E3A0|nr:CinA family nicotinamide mononucleotide deamidase-related protein [Actinoallomurus rhizosphaericola]MCO5992354.1 CinA family nicotinamide mononucleotide deamidase-related protein [Actinoallomurus rhizosphaericola]